MIANCKECNYCFDSNVIKFFISESRQTTFFTERKVISWNHREWQDLRTSILAVSKYFHSEKYLHGSGRVHVYLHNI